jgi:hypothetical protein
MACIIKCYPQETAPSGEFEVDVRAFDGGKPLPGDPVYVWTMETGGGKGLVMRGTLSQVSPSPQGRHLSLRVSVTDSEPARSYTKAMLGRDFKSRKPGPEFTLAKKLLQNSHKGLRLLDYEEERLLQRFFRPDDEGEKAVIDQRNFVEGACQQLTRDVRERNPLARNECLRIHECKCAVCGFDFEKRFGAIGMNFIHVHHRTPMARIAGERTTNARTDLIPVCPNCHAMLHRRSPVPYSIEELQDIIRQHGDWAEH